jgi:hemoglobin
MTTIGFSYHEPRTNRRAPSLDLTSIDDVELLVRCFYRDAAVDVLLGPVFATAGVDWSVHIPRLVEFWSWQLLGMAVYTGQPMRAHERAHGLVPFTDAHYERWLELFDDVVDDQFIGPTAELAKHRARKIATAMRRILPAPGEPPVGQDVPPSGTGVGAHTG